MNKNQMTLSNRQDAIKRYVLATIAMMVFVAFAANPGLLTVFADDTDIVGGLMSKLVGLVKSVATYAGIIITLWGAFQAIMAFRREDSEAVSKQITTIVVGGLLLGFGVFADELLALAGHSDLGGNANQGGNTPK